jgi:hypothetical protein
MNSERMTQKVNNSNNLNREEGVVENRKENEVGGVLHQWEDERRTSKLIQDAYACAGWWLPRSHTKH